MTSLDIRGTITGSTALAYKAPCLVATTGNITLSGAQTIDGVLVGNNGERVLVKDQNNLTENGIYNAETSDWTYATDWSNNNNVSDGTQVLVTSGTTNAGLIFVQSCADSPIIIGTSLISFTALLTIGGGFRGFNLKSFGAVGDGATDDTAAIVAWLAALQGSTPAVGYAPAGNYVFKSSLSIGAGGKGEVCIYGDGPYQTIFTYAGSSTTLDMLTIGDGITECHNWNFHDFRMTSSTTMTAGSAFRTKLLGRSFIRNVVMDGQDGTGKFWNGFWFDAIDTTTLDGFEARGQNDGLRCNGKVGGPQGDLFIRSGKIASCNVGLRIGGAIGGVNLDDTDIIVNNINVSIDQTIVATANNQIFFGKGLAIDTPLTGPSMQVLDLGASESYLFLTGTWIASSPNNGFNVGPGSTFKIAYTGGAILNNQHDGFYDGSGGTAKISLHGVVITRNGGSGTGYAVNSSAPVTIPINDCVFTGNVTGNIAAGITVITGNYSY